MAKLPKQSKSTQVKAEYAGEKDLYFIPLDTQGRIGKWVRRNAKRMSKD